MTKGEALPAPDLSHTVIAALVLSLVIVALDHPTPSLPGLTRQSILLPEASQLDARVEPGMTGRGRFFRDGYRFGKGFGKRSCNELIKPLRRGRFFNRCGFVVARPFTFDSSRCLNCCSNLARHHGFTTPAKKTAGTGKASRGEYPDRSRARWI
ncbi:MAG: hypothetical protein EPO23_05135 [Xanthobacteraceae bacterium]|nr:MAG: hypothetical protein EPO23_05135 [Xanthobacteraceae bacterium]